MSARREFRGARASGVLAKAFRLRGLFCRVEFGSRALFERTREKSPSSRNAKASTRNECAPRIPIA